jgi:hypothetical protein
MCACLYEAFCQELCLSLKVFLFTLTVSCFRSSSSTFAALESSYFVMLDGHKFTGFRFVPGTNRCFVMLDGHKFTGFSTNRCFVMLDGHKFTGFRFVPGTQSLFRVLLEGCSCYKFTCVSSGF